MLIEPINSLGSPPAPSGIPPIRMSLLMNRMPTGKRGAMTKITGVFVTGLFCKIRATRERTRKRSFFIACIFKIHKVNQNVIKRYKSFLKKFPLFGKHTPMRFLLLPAIITRVQAGLPISW